MAFRVSSTVPRTISPDDPVSWLHQSGSTWPIVFSSLIGCSLQFYYESVSGKCGISGYRSYGFIEGQNLTIIPTGFGVRRERLAEVAAEIVHAGRDRWRSRTGFRRSWPRGLYHFWGLARTWSGRASWLRCRGQAATYRPQHSLPELDGKRLDILLKPFPHAALRHSPDSNATSPQHLQRLRDAARAGASSF